MMIVIYYRTHTQRQEKMTLENKNDTITTQHPRQKHSHHQDKRFCPCTKERKHVWRSRNI